MKDEKKRPTVFVSGHMDLTVAEFEEHYKQRIYVAASKGSHFVVGDAPGCDEMAQKYIHSLTPRLIIYHMFDSPRRTVFDVRQAHRRDVHCGGFITDEERDAAMTFASDGDIAWVRPGKRGRTSGTAKNLLRRESHTQELRRLERATWPRARVIDDYDCNFGYGPYAMSATPETIDSRQPGTHIPVPPDFHQRYNDACAAYCAVKRELNDLVHEARNMGDLVVKYDIHE